MATERKHFSGLMSFWCNGNRNWNKSEIPSLNWIPHTWKAHGHFDFICWKHTISISIRHDNVFIPQFDSTFTFSSNKTLRNNCASACVTVRYVCVCVFNVGKWFYLDRFRLLVCIVIALNAKSSPYGWNQWYWFNTWIDARFLRLLDSFFCRRLPTCCTYSAHKQCAHTYIHVEKWCLKFHWAIKLLETENRHTKRPIWGDLFVRFRHWWIDISIECDSNSYLLLVTPKWMDYHHWAYTRAIANPKPIQILLWLSKQSVYWLGPSNHSNNRFSVCVWLFKSIFKRHPINLDEYVFRRAQFTIVTPKKAIDAMPCSSAIL